MAINVAIMGFGTVGSGVAETLDINRDLITKRVGEEINLKYILDIRDFPESRFADLVTHNADEVFDSDILIAVETIGGARIAYEYTKRALSLGISVVTSNKELVSTKGPELLKIAAENNCCYLFEAAVGGGIPIIRPLYKCLAANKITRIAGIVNGTTNYILSQMKDEGIDFDTALKQAQDNGFAEANPSADIDGIDAQRKISILSTIANDGAYIAPESINAEGISAITTDDMKFAASIGCDIKLIALYESGEDLPVVYVAPALVDKSNLLFNVGGVFNAVMVDGNSLGQAMFYGQGAGTLPTASAVCGDILEAALGNPPEARAWTEESVKITPYDEISADIVIRADVPAKVVDAAEGYVCEVLSDEAILVKGIMHKDIAAIVSKAEAKSWMHYLK
ncbi:MAG: homoserine dehydrogenase [Clostridiales bacterium]|nr:homoserine dehydrogenase [Clostridiales bacterium]